MNGSKPYHSYGIYYRKYALFAGKLSSSSCSSSHFHQSENNNIDTVQLSSNSFDLSHTMDMFGSDGGGIDIVDHKITVWGCEGGDGHYTMK